MTQPAPITEPVLILDDVTKHYASHAVLQGVNLSLGKGQTKVLMGPSGTGKSTLLHCINLLAPPDSGRIRLNGVNILEPQTNVDKVRSSIGMVFQDFSLFAHLTALDNVRIGLVKVKRMAKDAATELAQAELRRVGLGDKLSSYPAQLSGGQQQRVSIARALALRPEVILFDEPTSALDPELTGEVLAVMTELATAGMTMLIASHEIGFARSVADEIVFMEGGKVVEQGPPAKIMGDPNHARTREFFSRIHH